MIIPQGWEFDFNKEISNDEYEVIEKFLATYRHQNIIVADEYRQDFGMVPLQDEKIIFKTNEDDFKCMSFSKEIYHKNKLYIVTLELWRTNNNETEPKCLQISDFNIIANGKVHFINLNTEDSSKLKCLFNIISIFDERKIISPEQAYCKRMYTDRLLQEFMFNHEWEKIEEGIKQMPTLANALFIIREGYEGYDSFTADFGTILYQLISYRQNNLNDLDKQDLLRLDKLILKLRKSDLLKVQLHEKTSGVDYCQTGSVLLKSVNHNGRMHKSQQYTITNTELSDETKTLNKCIRALKQKQY